MVYAEITVFVVAFALCWYWSRDKQSRTRYLYASFVAFGVVYGLLAWSKFIDHSPRWQAWTLAALAALFPVSGSGVTARKARGNDGR